MTPLRARAALASVHLPVHGGIDYAEVAALGLTPDDIVDFSANLNPWGAPPAAIEAAMKAPLHRYPDSEALALRRALATHLSNGDVALDAENIIVGNGSSELLWLVAFAFVEQGDPVVIVGPTFGEYRRAALLAGAEVQCFDARQEDDFRIDVAALREKLEAGRRKIIFLCNPNNPTGVYLDRHEVLSLCSNERLLVLDEAYAGFLDKAWQSCDLLSRGVVVVRSMTKDYCLAGLRLGYAVASADIIASLRKVRPPWNVNAMAQAAGLACVSSSAHVEGAKDALQYSMAYLSSSLRGLGLRVIPTSTTFCLVEVGNAAAFRNRLLRDGLLIRDCTSFGLPTMIRIAARSLPECQRLVEAIGRAMVAGS